MQDVPCVLCPVPDCDLPCIVWVWDDPGWQPHVPETRVSASKHVFCPDEGRLGAQQMDKRSTPTPYPLSAPAASTGCFQEPPSWQAKRYPHLEEEETEAQKLIQIRAS